MIERQIDNPMPRRLSRTNKIRAFWRKVGNSIAASAGVWTQFPGPKLLEPTAQDSEKPASASLSWPLCRTDNFGNWNSHHRAIDRDEVMQIARSRVESLRPAALAIAVVIFCTELAVL
jgi:hypothetical protein